MYMGGGGGVVVMVQLTLGWFKHSLTLFIHTPDRTIHHEACDLRGLHPGVRMGSQVCEKQNPEV